MKFGKLLLRSVSLTMVAWREKWMDYKRMKTLLYAASDAVAALQRPAVATADELENFIGACTGGREHSAHSRRTHTALAPPPAAVVPSVNAFFESLRSQLQMVAVHYAECEAQLSQSYNTLISGLERFALSVAGSEADKSPATQAARSEGARRLLADAVRLTSSLIQLENYAVLNYCAFAKIMKKMEKVTGIPCKTAYMQCCVNVQEFGHYPRLLRMLSGTERAYSLLVALQPDDAAVSVDLEDVARLADLRDVQATSSLKRRKELDGEAAAAAVVQQQQQQQQQRGGKRTRSGSVSDHGVVTRQRTAEGAGDATQGGMRRTASELQLANLLAGSG
jgi:hypothetical protein